jgi:hypothetical protein
MLARRAALAVSLASLMAPRFDRVGIIMGVNSAALAGRLGVFRSRRDTKFPGTDDNQLSILRQVKNSKERGRRSEVHTSPTFTETAIRFYIHPVRAVYATDMCVPRAEITSVLFRQPLYLAFLPLHP